jgi:hypothetical protein
VTLDTNRLSEADIRTEVTKINLLNYVIICEDKFMFATHTTLNLERDRTLCTWQCLGSLVSNHTTDSAALDFAN